MAYRPTPDHCFHIELWRLSNYETFEYSCLDCGQLFSAKPLQIGVSFGYPPKPVATEPPKLRRSWLWRMLHRTTTRH